MNLMDLAKRAEKLAVDNSPSILTALGVTGTLSTAYLTARAGYKTAQRLSTTNPRETTLEKSKRVWKLYIPAASMGTVTIASIIMANRIGNKRAAAMAAAYAISEKAFVEYKDKVIEKIGEKKEQNVRDEIAQDRVTNNPPGNQLTMLGTGEVLCYESLTGRYFNSSMEKLKQAENEINHQLITDGYASLTDFYALIGLPMTTLSEELGWNMDKLMELRFSSVLSEDNRPCLSVEFSVAPIRGYHKFH